MHNNILLVQDNTEPPALAGNMDEWKITRAATAAEALALLEEPVEWHILVSASRLADMEGLAFLKRASTLSDAVPLLLSPDTGLAAALHQANSLSIFRVIPLSTPVTTLRIILRDAGEQFRLRRQGELMRQRIEQLTIEDPLTGCYTRDHILEYLTRELRRAVRFSHYLSVLLCDLDGLRHINQEFGQEAGDRVLAGFGRNAMRLVRRDIDTVTRWGEDEFLLVLPETNVRGAGRVAVRLRDSFSRLGLRHNGRPIECTACYGASGFAPETPERNATPEALLLIAGRCLVQAKAAGGNQVLCCP